MNFKFEEIACAKRSGEVSMSYVTKQTKKNPIYSAEMPIQAHFIGRVSGLLGAHVCRGLGCNQHLHYCLPWCEIHS